MARIGFLSCRLFDVCIGYHLIIFSFWFLTRLVVCTSLFRILDLPYGRLSRLPWEFYCFPKTTKPSPDSSIERRVPSLYRKGSGEGLLSLLRTHTGFKPLNIKTKPCHVQSFREVLMGFGNGSCNLYLGETSHTEGKPQTGYKPRAVRSF